jgi:hypothetical protein
VMSTVASVGATLSMAALTERIRRLLVCRRL